MKTIQRPAYLDRITPFINKNIIKVLTGQRRVGKSYMLRQLIDKIKLLDPQSNIIFAHRSVYKFWYFSIAENIHMFKNELFS